MQHEAPDGRRVAAFFDLDKTILAAASTLALGRSFRRRGLLPPHTAARSAYAHAAFMLRGADHHQMERMRELLSELVTGWEVETIRSVVDEAMDEVLMPLVYPEAAELIRWHQQYGRDVVVISSGADEIVGPIGERLGVDHVVGTRMEVVDGRYTGVVDFYAYGEAKADVVRALAHERGYDLDHCFGYSDSITDLPMLQAVGRPHAVNPDRQLAAHAEAAGWPVLQLVPSQPAATGFPGPTATTVGTVGAVGVVTAAGLGWYLARRRRTR